MTAKDSQLNIGAHKSASGGYARAVERVSNIGGTCLQLFSSSPRAWAGPNLTDDDVKEFEEKTKKLEVDPVVFHAPYLINLADRGQTGEKSVRALITELKTASRCGVIGSIIHVGSYKTDDNQPEDDEHYEHLLANTRTVLEETPRDTWFIIENMGTRKIGRKIEEIGQLISDLGGGERLKVCLDTCHLHVAGYDLSSPEKCESFLAEFDNLVGLERLVVIHANDSKDPAGSLRDRHENIGEGEVPKEVFSSLLSHKVTRQLPFIIETPGFGGNGPDKENINKLKKLS